MDNIQIPSDLNAILHLPTKPTNSLKKQSDRATHLRILEVFGRDTSSFRFIFEFNTEKHSVQHWLRLYAAAMRCAVEQHDDGFLFIGWADKNPVTAESWGHSCTFYYDNRRKHQVFIDPSTACTDTTAGNMLQLFAHRHLWDQSGTATTATVDLDLTTSKHYAENLQNYFCSPRFGTPNEEACNLTGCCATMSILIVLVSLRFRSRDPQMVVDAIRCVMRHMRKNIGSDELFNFLMRLRGWHEKLNHPSLSKEAFMRMLHITRDPGDTTSKCRAMEYRDGKFTGICDRVHDGRFAWCTLHRPANMGNMAWIEQRNWAPLAWIPSYVEFREVEAVGHFDVAWRDRNWDCALDTMVYQLNDYLRRPNSKSLAALRFIETAPEDVTNILVNLIGPDQWRGLQTLGILLLEVLCWSYRPSLWDTFRSTVVRHVPLFAWRVAYVVACWVPVYMVVDMMPLREFEFDRIIRAVPMPDENASCGLYLIITQLFSCILAFTGPVPL